MQDLSSKWYAKLMGKASIGLAWFTFALVFVLSLCSLHGEFVFAGVFWIYMLFSLVDAYRKYGLSQMMVPEPLGRNWYLFRFGTLLISGVVNIYVYARILLHQ